MRSKRSITTKNRPAKAKKAKHSRALIPKGSAHNKRRARAKGLRIFSASHNKPVPRPSRHSSSSKYSFDTKRVRGLSIPVLMSEFNIKEIDALDYDVSIMLTGSKLPKHPSVIGCVATTGDYVQPFLESVYSSIAIIGSPPEEATIDAFEKSDNDYQEIPGGYLVKPGRPGLPLTKFAEILD